MITTKGHSPWPGDTAIEDLGESGLDHPSIVRLKLFTLDHRLIIRTIASLSKSDAKSERNFLEDHLGSNI